MKCVEAQSLFSPYLDGAVTGTQMRAIREHLDACNPCRREYILLTHTQQLLAWVRRRKAPDDLSLRLRLAISREAAEARKPPLDGLWVRFENELRAFMVPATAGMVLAIAVFGFVMGFLTLPELEARSRNDV